ncbi:hypothetical protein DIS18_09105 [Algibacter marinivivus]|uniref:Alpha-L-glutamate ligase-related protein ATP-grasp domain-containing protein n=1 Tax=Algibacter marinivivus TaxID=2100723 RepID=A0A2U2X3P7_9FLAO|nr:sugar-transfer associated ATP-grasp domain-containing protein [Algibacter marinivivus]PWH82401.1 hypothetical protein DIS18_09105 [Algibacter marinivivus]
MNSLIKNRLNYFKYFLKDPNKKGFFRMCFELIHFWWIKKVIPIDYFRRLLYRKEVNNYHEYLSLKEYRRVLNSDKIIFPEIGAILNNKLCTDIYFKNMELSVPKMISHNMRNHFFLNNKTYTVNNNNDLISFFSNIFKSYSLEELFLKPLVGIGGDGIILLKKETLKQQIEQNSKQLFSNSFIHQEKVEQHSDINKIHPKTLNTLRVLTYIDNNKNMQILSIVMRFGVGDNITDNVSAGGFYIPVNMKTGCIEGIGRQDLNEGGGIFIKHPNSGVVLEGFKIPFFKESCELAKSAANHLPCRLVGWDIAISKEGPVIIEGNETPGMVMTDIACGGHLKDPLVLELLELSKT